ncbi:MAG: transposase domain-containing protein [Lewinellaceae bacterium]|nr:transposase domain-containing protein [Lewinellaceae bacterium]
MDPVEWLEDVMIRLPDHPVNRIEELLPHLWKKAEDRKM